MTRKLYDPQLAPEREVVAAKTALTKRRTLAVTRSGEQYICTCPALHLIVTSDASEADGFAERHQEHLTTESAPPGPPA